MGYDYARALCKKEVFVFLIDRLCLHAGLVDAITEASEKYGFQFQVGADMLDSACDNNCVVKHGIIIDGLDNPEYITKKYSYLLEKCTSVTIALSYSNKSSFLKAGDDIERLKLQYGSQVNYLLPILTEGSYIPSKQKLVDNAICDSVRIKYVPHKVGELKYSGISRDIETFFQRASTLIKSEHLYHRSSTDGFISMRGEGNSFYITCTKTDKVDLDLSRVALVHGYDRNKNHLFYSGSYLPSSDSVEAAVLYQNRSWIRALVHTHASRQFTRNPRYKSKIAIPPSCYGEAELGERISNFLINQNVEDFVIMEDHGEMFFSGKDSPAKMIEEISNCIYNETKSIQFKGR